MCEQIKMNCKDGTVIKGLAWEIEKATANLVIITGMQEHSKRYNNFAEFLNKNGISVFCLDHFEQGENNINPEYLGRWEKSGFSKMVKRIDELVATLRITCRPTYLLGHSLGSFIAQDYIQRHSDHIEKVILMGTCGPRRIIKFGEVLSKLLTNKRNYHKKAKLLKKLAFGPFDKLIKNPETEFDWLSINKDNVRDYIDDEKCGVDVTNGFYKEFFKGLNRLRRKKFYKKIRKNLPILIVSGIEDPVGMYGKGITRLESIYKKTGISDVEVTLYDNMRHEILFEDDKTKVYKDILEFIKK